MIPLRDDNPTRITPWVTWAILAANIAVYFLQVTGGMYSTRTGLEGSLAGWTMIPFEVTRGIDIIDMNGPTLRPFWLTIFTSMFMHGGLMHILGNMVYLIVFGNNIEDALGHGRFILFYLVCGALAALAQIFWNPASQIPTLGASGAIAGVLGAYLLLFPHAHVNTLVFLGIFITTIRLPALILLGFWIISQFFSHVTGSLSGPEGRETGGVAYMAHIGGFIAGFVLIKLFGGQPPRERYSYRPGYVRDDGRFRF